MFPQVTAVARAREAPPPSPGGSSPRWHSASRAASAARSCHTSGGDPIVLLQGTPMLSTRAGFNTYSPPSNVARPGGVRWGRRRASSTDVDVAPGLATDRRLISRSRRPVTARGDKTLAAPPRIPRSGVEPRTLTAALRAAYLGRRRARPSSPQARAVCTQRRSNSNHTADSPPSALPVPQRSASASTKNRPRPDVPVGGSSPNSGRLNPFPRSPTTARTRRGRTVTSTMIRSPAARSAWRTLFDTSSVIRSRRLKCASR
jgi:hypothetical protein